MSALDHLKCGLGVTVDEAMKTAAFALEEDLRGVFPMACRVLADEVRKLRSELDTAKQWRQNENL